MRVTIVKEDNAVVVDGVRHTVDCSALPADFHALQWDGTAGQVEHCVTRCDHCGARTKKGNEIVMDLSPYQPYLDGWKRAAIEADQARAKADAAGPKG